MQLPPSFRPDEQQLPPSFMPDEPTIGDRVGPPPDQVYPNRPGDTTFAKPYRKLDKPPVDVFSSGIITPEIAGDLDPDLPPPGMGKMVGVDPLKVPPPTPPDPQRFFKPMEGTAARPDEVMFDVDLQPTVEKIINRIGQSDTIPEWLKPGLARQASMGSYWLELIGNMIGDPASATGLLYPKAPPTPPKLGTAKIGTTRLGSIGPKPPMGGTLQERYPAAPGVFTTNYSSVNLPEEAFVKEPRGLGWRPTPDDTPPVPRVQGTSPTPPSPSSGQWWDVFRRTPPDTGGGGGPTTAGGYGISGTSRPSEFPIPQVPEVPAGTTRQVGGFSITPGTAEGRLVPPTLSGGAKPNPKWRPAPPPRPLRPPIEQTGAAIRQPGTPGAGTGTSGFSMRTNIPHETPKPPLEGVKPSGGLGVADRLTQREALDQLNHLRKIPEDQLTVEIAQEMVDLAKKLKYDQDSQLKVVWDHFKLTLERLKKGQQGALFPGRDEQAEAWLRELDELDRRKANVLEYQKLLRKISPGNYNIQGHPRDYIRGLLNERIAKIPLPEERPDVTTDPTFGPNNETALQLRVKWNEIQQKLNEGTATPAEYAEYHRIDRLFDDHPEILQDQRLSQVNQVPEPTPDLTPDQQLSTNLSNIRESAVYNKYPHLRDMTPQQLVDHLKSIVSQGEASLPERMAIRDLFDINPDWFKRLDKPPEPPISEAYEGPGGKGGPKKPKGEPGETTHFKYLSDHLPAVWREFYRIISNPKPNMAELVRLRQIRNVIREQFTDVLNPNRLNVFSEDIESFIRDVESGRNPLEPLHPNDPLKGLSVGELEKVIGQIVDAREQGKMTFVEEAVLERAIRQSRIRSIEANKEFQAEWGDKLRSELELERQKRLMEGEGPSTVHEMGEGPPRTPTSYQDRLRLLDEYKRHVQSLGIEGRQKLVKAGEKIADFSRTQGRGRVKDVWVDNYKDVGKGAFVKENDLMQLADRWNKTQRHRQIPSEAAPAEPTTTTTGPSAVSEPIEGQAPKPGQKSPLERQARIHELERKPRITDTEKDELRYLRVLNQQYQKLLGHEERSAADVDGIPREASAAIPEAPTTTPEVTAENPPAAAPIMETAATVAPPRLRKKGTTTPVTPTTAAAAPGIEQPLTTPRQMAMDFAGTLRPTGDKRVDDAIERVRQAFVDHRWPKEGFGKIEGDLLILRDSELVDWEIRQQIFDVKRTQPELVHKLFVEDGGFLKHGKRSSEGGFLRIGPRGMPRMPPGWSTPTGGGPAMGGRSSGPRRPTGGGGRGGGRIPPGPPRDITWGTAGPWDYWNLARGMGATDLVPFTTSAAFRQGWMDIGNKNWWRALYNAARSYGWEESFNAIEGARLRHRFSRPGRTGKSVFEEADIRFSSMDRRLGPREEQIRGELAEKIPLYGRHVKRSNRAYTTFVNDLRFHKAKDLIEWTGAENNVPLLKDIGKFVNYSTGAGSLGPLEPIEGLLGKIFWSPRNVTSRLEVVNELFNPLTYSKQNFPIKRQLWGQVIKAAGVWATMTQLAKMAGYEVVMDPTNSDFGKIKVNGKVRLDPGAGFLQIVVALSRMGLNPLSSKSGYTSSTTGEHRPLGGPNVLDPTYGSIIADYFGNKLHPNAGIIYDLWNAKQGRPMYIPDAIIQAHAPMAAGDLAQILVEDPTLAGIVTMLSSMGIGSQVYEKNREEPTIWPNPILPNLPNYEWEGTDMFRDTPPSGRSRRPSRGEGRPSRPSR